MKIQQSIVLFYLIICGFPGASFAITLEESLIHAYEWSPLLKAERHALHGAHEAMPQALAKWLPTVNYNYTKGDEESTFGSAPTTDTDVTQSSLSLSQPLFKGGEGLASLKRAKHTIAAATENYRRNEQEILLNAVIAYMDVLQSERILALSQHNEKVLQEHRELTKSRFELGEVTRTDVAQSDARVAIATSDRIAAAGTLQTAHATFKRNIGIKAYDISLPSSFPELPSSAEEVTNHAVHHNPSLKRVDLSRQVSNEDVKIAYSNLLPTSDLILKHDEDEGRALFGGRDLEQDSMTFQFNVPLYQAGSAYSRVREAKDLRKQNVLRYEESRNRTIETSTQTWQRYIVGRATVNSRREAVKAAKVASEGVTLEAEVGSRTVLDVLDAEQELFITKVRLVRAQREAVVAAYGVLSVMGKLTARQLQLPVQYYDSNKDYKRTKFKIIGF